MKTKPKPKPTMKGFSCPECRGLRLHVSHVVRPMPGLIVRYRKCTVCEYQVVTEERKRKAK